MNSESTPDKQALKDLEQKYEAAGEEARNYIMHDMEKRGYDAIVWGANLFGSTDYPLIDFNGKDTTLKGFRLIGTNRLVAIVGLPDSLNVTGVKTFSSAEADNKLGTVAHDQNFYDDGGTPEQWEVAADCYKVAVEMIARRNTANQAEAWW